MKDRILDRNHQMYLCNVLISAEMCTTHAFAQRRLNLRYKLTIRELCPALRTDAHFMAALLLALSPKQIFFFYSGSAFVSVGLV